ncbi:MAG: hypothetical protein HRU15_03535 [Planctomycetes bacterium]|nr:hypothetical protein [Planctomycetota bacterium]
MATNLDIDITTVKALMEIGNFKTKRQAVDAAVAEALAYRRQLKACGSLGTIDFIPLAVEPGPIDGNG